MYFYVYPASRNYFYAFSARTERPYLMMKGKSEVALSTRSVKIEEEDIKKFIADMEAKGRSHITVRKYNRVLHVMYRLLPDDKMLYKDTFRSIALPIRERRHYSASTMNSAISAFNEFVKFKGYGDFCIPHIPDDSIETPVPTVEEYHKLLMTAKSSNDYLGYLLVKLFANTSVRVHDMSDFTIDAVQSGFVRPKGELPIRLSMILQQELMDLAASKGISEGCIITSRSGKPLTRHMVTKIISDLAERAGFEDGYITPRSLKKLYESRIGEIRAQMESLVEQNYDYMMFIEQQTVGWH